MIVISKDILDGEERSHRETLTSLERPTTTEKWPTEFDDAALMVTRCSGPPILERTCEHWIWGKSSGFVGLSKGSVRLGADDERSEYRSWIATTRPA